MIREGFVRKEFEAIAPIARRGLDLHRMMIVSDLFDPADLAQGRGMNALLARAVALGIDPLVAVQMVTRNVADYYGLRDLGGVAPGKIADLVLVEDLRDFECRRVWAGGRLAVDRGQPLLSADPFVYPPEARRSFSLLRIEPESLALPAPHPETPVRVVKAVGATITRESTARLVSQKGFLEADLRQDILKMAVFQRSEALPRPALGFAQGIGLKQGAVATSFTWDTGNLLVIGVSDREMALAANRLLDLGGGLVVAAGDRVLTEMPMPIMGLISEEPLPELIRQIKALEQAFRTLGSGLERPFLTLQTFCFTGLPFIRLTDKGLMDVRGKKPVDLFLEKEVR
jgi:adenine deaminase